MTVLSSLTGFIISSSSVNQISRDQKRDKQGNKYAESKKIVTVDVNQVILWKDGKLSFRDETLKEILKLLSHSAPTTGGSLFQFKELLSRPQENQKQF